MVEETLVPGAVVSEVARRHGLTPQQLFTWRREARRSLDEEPAAPLFIPAVVAAVDGPASASPASTPVRRRSSGQARFVAVSTIELEIDGVKVRVGSGADAATITMVIRALKAGA